MRFAQNLPRSRINVDEHHAPALNELQAIGHRSRIIFGAKVLHSALARQHARLDLAQRTHVALAQIAPHIVLLIGALLRLCGRGKGDEEAKGEKRCGPTHDA